jgi:hypothetical protein
MKFLVSYKLISCIIFITQIHINITKIQVFNKEKAHRKIIVIIAEATATTHAKRKILLSVSLFYDFCINIIIINYLQFY